ncbi:MAG: hypothetical protein U5K00_21395 [Melioribacteraceae bacterium]|nr:hypothetical protein [Melioribacteraceae bacterium]
MSIGQIVWSSDSKTIYFDSGNEVNNSIYSIDVESQEVTTLYEPHVNSSLVLATDNSKIYFKQQRNDLPYEIFSIGLDGENFSQITSVNKELLSEIEFGEFGTFWSEGAEGAQVQSDNCNAAIF